ncbi:hypothetical protein PHET_01571 [Paragonimus heterotremus]|uniref:Uncharacterized protein n=1 Tax=Paragonimus heterotremus TaxID=100268 RepID=A0A8J4TH72_9TREM|nr:hypothetical protein PHET_01571 [Paragonimus heterotremus]
MDRLSTNSNAREVEDYSERSDNWCLTKSDLDEKKKVAFFLHFIVMEAYALVEESDFPGVTNQLFQSHAKENTLPTPKAGEFCSSLKSQFQCANSVRVPNRFLISSYNCKCKYPSMNTASS